MVTSIGSPEIKEASLSLTDYLCSLLTTCTWACPLLYPCTQALQQSGDLNLFCVKSFGGRAGAGRLGREHAPIESSTIAASPTLTKGVIFTGLPTGPALTASPFLNS